MVICNESLELLIITACFKTTFINLVTKNLGINEMHDYRLVALTSIVTKTFE